MSAEKPSSKVLPPYLAETKKALLAAKASLNSLAAEQPQKRPKLSKEQIEKREYIETELNFTVNKVKELYRNEVKSIKYTIQNLEKFSISLEFKKGTSFKINFTKSKERSPFNGDQYTINTDQVFDNGKTASVPEDEGSYKAWGLSDLLFFLSGGYERDEQGQLKRQTDIKGPFYSILAKLLKINPLPGMRI